MATMLLMVQKWERGGKSHTRFCDEEIVSTHYLVEKVKYVLTSNCDSLKKFEKGYA